MKQGDLLSEESGREKESPGGGGVHVRAGRAAGSRGGCKVSRWKRGEKSLHGLAIKCLAWMCPF